MDTIRATVQSQTLCQPTHAAQLHEEQLRIQTQELKVNAEENKLLGYNIIFDLKEKSKSYCGGNINKHYKKGKATISGKYILDIAKSTYVKV